MVFYYLINKYLVNNYLKKLFKKNYLNNKNFDYLISNQFLKKTKRTST